MKDIHSHILPGIDDGARNVEESIKLLEKFYDNGVTDIILTPHYIYNSNFHFWIARGIFGVEINKRVRKN